MFAKEDVVHCFMLKGMMFVITKAGVIWRFDGFQMALARPEWKKKQSEKLKAVLAQPELREKILAGRRAAALRRTNADDELVT